jgi:hypothetical protein
MTQFIAHLSNEDRLSTRYPVADEGEPSLVRVSGRSLRNSSDHPDPLSCPDAPLGADDGPPPQRGNRDAGHAGEDNKRSVVSGLVTSARMITAAALIMVFVFGSFVLNGDPTVKQFGIGLAVEVILDATIVRCLQVPALMVVMGKVNWYMPRWLDRLLPRVSIEGAEFFRARDPRPRVEPDRQREAVAEAVVS